MARPPRGRMPDSDRFGSEAGADELPLELPRVEPVRPRVARNIEKRSSRSEGDDVLSTRSDRPAGRLPPAPRATDAYIPDPKPSSYRSERLADPFDYYAVPPKTASVAASAGSKPTTGSVRAPESEYITSKYYEPRSDFLPSSNSTRSDDPVDSWPNFVKPTRPIRDFDESNEAAPNPLSSYPQQYSSQPISEIFGSTMPIYDREEDRFEIDADDRSPMLRPSPFISVGMIDTSPETFPKSDSVPHLPKTSDDPFGSFVTENDESIAHSREDKKTVRPNISATIDMRGADRDTRWSPSLAVEPAGAPSFANRTPITADARIPSFRSQSSDMRMSAPHRSTTESRVSVEPEAPIPDWMRRGGHANSFAVSTHEWGQEDALQTIAARVRDRSAGSPEQTRADFADTMVAHLRQAFGRWRDALQTRKAKLKAKTSLPQKQRDAQFGSEPASPSMMSSQTDKRIDFDMAVTPVLPTADGLSEPAQSSIRMSEDLRATRALSTSSSVDALSIGQSGLDGFPTDVPSKHNRFWSLFKRRTRSPATHFTSPNDRVQSRRKQARLYEDIVAWIVVPPFIIGMIYGGLELAKFLSNSPLGKLLSGQ